VRDADGGGVKYPKEWPGFEVVDTQLRSLAPLGSVVEGTIGEDWNGEYLGFIGSQHDDKMPWFAFRPNDVELVTLKPLTPAAEDMLALIRERSSR
jgi:hypothetical protein